jgi:hypothetical protein
MEKATREAKVAHQLDQPERGVRRGAARVHRRILAPGADGSYGEFMRDLRGVRRGHRAGPACATRSRRRSSSSPAPGVPDLYQGQELWDLSLVDPDNRRPVDYDRRRKMLDDIRKSMAGGDRRSLAVELGRGLEGRENQDVPRSPRAMSSSLRTGAVPIRRVRAPRGSWRARGSRLRLRQASPGQSGHRCRTATNAHPYPSDGPAGVRSGRLDRYPDRARPQPASVLRIGTPSPATPSGSGATAMRTCRSPISGATSPSPCSMLSEFIRSPPAVRLSRARESRRPGDAPRSVHRRLDLHRQVLREPAHGSDIFRVRVA